MKKYLYLILGLIIKSYYRLRNYVFWGDFEKKHIVFEKNGDQIKVTIKSHSELVEETQKKIDAMNKRKEKTFISAALNLAREGCNSIEIQKGNQTVLFWTNHGNFDFCYGFDTSRKNHSAYYPIIGLLADMDFLRNDYNPSAIPTFMGTPKYRIYKVEKDEKMTVINGYFGRQNEYAAEFVLRTFTEIYMIKRGKMEIRVG